MYTYPSVTPIRLSVPAEDALAGFIKVTALSAIARADAQMIWQLRILVNLTNLRLSQKPSTLSALQSLTLAASVVNSLTPDQANILEPLEDTLYDLSVRHAAEEVMDITVSEIITNYYPASKALIARHFTTLKHFFSALKCVFRKIYGFLQKENISIAEVDNFIKDYESAELLYREKEGGDDDQ